MQKYRPKNFHFLLLSLYVLSYFILRITASPYLDWDEAEQYLNSRNFNLGDTQQPPLYSWIVRILSLLSNDSPYALISVRYICLYLFVIFLYLSIKEFFTAKKSLLLSCLILALIPSYAYTINFKLTHSVLVFAMAAMSFYYYLRVLKKGTLLNFFLFGTAIGLGLLSKYNFSFLLGGLILGSILSKSARKAFLRPELLLAIATSLIIAVPHYLWLYKNFTQAATYLSNRGHFKINLHDDYNYLFNFFKLALSSITQLLIFSAFLILLYLLNKLQKPTGLNNKQEYLNNIIQVLGYISLFSYLVPILAFLVFKSEKLLSGWLSVSHFITAIFLYMIFEKISKKKFHKMSFKIAFICIVILFCIKYLWIFHPALFSKTNTININYRVLVNKLEQIKAENQRIICDDQMVYVNLKILKPEWKLSYLKNIKTKKRNLRKLDIEVPLLHSKPYQHKNQSINFFINK